MVQTIRKFIQSQPPTSIPATPKKKSLDEQIKEARDYARMITEISGVTSPEAAVAWDVLEELMAAKAHQKAKNTFEDYCETYPDAPEARMYDV